MSDEIKIGSVLVWGESPRGVQRYVVTGSTRTSWIIQEQVRRAQPRTEGGVARYERPTYGPDLSTFEEKVDKKTLQFRGKNEYARLVTLAQHEDRVEAYKILPRVKEALDGASLGTLRAVAALLGLDLSSKTE